MARIGDHDALTFDVYGTLIDWEPSIVAFFRDWGLRNGVAAADGEYLDAFDRARSALQSIRPALPYPEVMGRSFAAVARRWGRSAAARERDAFARSVPSWPPFADTIESLRHLRGHFRMGCVSNIDDRSLEATLAALGVEWDFTVTAERVGAYKPDTPHFLHLVSQCGRLGVAPDRILHVAQSLRADIAPAGALGLRCAWIRRAGRALGRRGRGTRKARADFTFDDLAALVARHRAEG